MGVAGGKGKKWLQLLHIPRGATLPADKAIPTRIASFNSKKAYFYRKIISFRQFSDDPSKFCKTRLAANCFYLRKTG
jgi:hypothetical protein